MAQAVFEEGPLEQYLRDAGEVHELLMPGISQSIIEDIDIHRHLYAFDSLHETGEGEEEMEWRPHCLIVGLNLLETFLSSTRPTHAPNPFVERFKYTIISSSLLSTSLSSSHQPATRSSIGSIPGNLKDDSLSIPPSSPSSSTTPHPNSSNHQPPPHYAYFSLAALAAALLLSFERRWLATLSLGGLSFLAYNLLATSETPSYDFTPTINALDDLVEANRIWESTVQDSIQTLEKEEATLLRSPTSAPSPSSNALRVAVHSALQTTRTQCDNVRQLFSALTCPSELSQLSEMYAPPSPVKSPLLLPNEGLTPARPYSYPSRHQFSPPPVASSPENKRATWSGSSSYTGLTSPVMSRRREKHRSNLSVLFQGSPTPSSASASTPITPFQTSPGPSLAQIAEDLHHQDSEEQNNGGGILLFQDDTESPVFGSAALDLQKQRKAEGYGTFELSPPAIPRSPPLSRSPNRLGRYSTFTSSSAPTTTFSSSRFTTFSSPAHHPSHRHPLSLYALNQALLSALSSRRYTCSHLLALRFNEEDGSSEEGREYWENVKSVVELLTTTFADESARLAEALEEVERQHLRDANPTPDISGEFEINRRRAAQHNRVGSGGSVSGLGLGIGHSPLTEGVLGYGVGGKRRTPLIRPCFLCAYAFASFEVRGACGCDLDCA
ncbi:hypothetical protein CC2G_012031 [Coprinopsis cinerea AmutBmut pab1-1]|nr:hypothetical protein CC2G_012031 [Coprinopsis cinerea AmutBmut pab1-1]